MVGSAAASVGDAYPDEIVRRVVEPIDKALGRARQQDQENVFQCAIWFGLRWTSGKNYCSLMLLTDPTLRAKHKVEDTQMGNHAQPPPEGAPILRREGWW